MIEPTPPTPFERLIAQRADPDELGEFRRNLDEPFEITWWKDDDERQQVSWYLGPEVSRTADYLMQIGAYRSDYEGTFAVMLHLQPGEPVAGVGEGYCALGTVLYSFDFYKYGADVAALGAAGVSISWDAAQWLYAVAREQLDELHAEDKVHGHLAPRRVRLGLFHRPYAQSKKRPRAHLGTHGARAIDAEVEHPPAFVFIGDTRTGDAADKQRDRATLAATLATLTHHPDPTIDRLLRDPESHEVLRDLLLERGGPIEQLLADRAGADLAVIPLPVWPSLGPVAEIDTEFEALWNAVLRLDPMIDTSDPKVFALSPPWITSIHGEPHDD